MILVTGASGKLGAYVVDALVKRGTPVTAWSHSRAGEVAGVTLQQVDFCDLDGVKAAYESVSPDAVIHCAALSAVGDCFRNPERADLINHQATALLGRLAKRIVYTSTDLVFDGEQAPYAEDSEPKPLSAYGRSKVAGERAILKESNGLVVRISLMFGPAGPGFMGGFFQQQVDSLEKGETLQLFTDEWRTPLALDEAAQALILACHSDSLGVFHLGGPERLSRFDMGKRIAQAYHFSDSLIVPLSQKAIDFGEPRPADVSLTFERAKREWGWSPTSYMVGLRRLIGNLDHPRSNDRQSP